MVIISKNLVEDGRYVCECGRVFEKAQSLYAHQGKCKVHLRERYDPEKHKGWNVGDARAWSRGKNKETDARIAQISEALKKHYETNGGSFKGKKHTEKTKSIMSEKARSNAKNHINGWKAGDSKKPNKYEAFTENYLKENNISYKKEVVIPQSLLGKKGSYYQLDFLVNEEIDLEIDGTSHSEEHDVIRDKFVGNLFKVHRINHGDDLDKLEELLSEFVKSL